MNKAFFFLHKYDLGHTIFWKKIVFAQSDQSSQGTIAKCQTRLHADSEDWSDLSESSLDAQAIL